LKHEKYDKKSFFSKKASSLIGQGKRGFLEVRIFKKSAKNAK